MRALKAEGIGPAAIAKRQGVARASVYLQSATHRYRGAPANGANSQQCLLERREEAFQKCQVILQPLGDYLRTQWSRLLVVFVTSMELGTSDESTYRSPADETEHRFSPHTCFGATTIKARGGGMQLDSRRASLARSLA
jgi:hypothetical protein